jgi:hypothetical protein
MSAHEIQAAAVARAGKKIEPGFEPFVKAMSNFDRLVPRVIGRQSAVVSFLRAFGGEVVVQLDHGHPAGNGLRSVDLDFVVVLGVSSRGEDADEGAAEDKTESGSVCQSSYPQELISRAGA